MVSPQSKSRKRRRPKTISANDQLAKLRKKIRPASRPSHIKTLIYGPSRSGKTVFVGSAGNDPRTSPTLILDFEGGTSSLVGLSDNIEVISIKSWDDYNDVYAYLVSGEHQYKSIGIDSLSETHIFSIGSVVDHAVAESERRTDPLQVEQSDYGKSLWQMRRFVRSFRDLPLHVFFTALPKSDLEPGEGWVRKPMVFGALAEELVGLFDVSAFLFIEGDDRATRRKAKTKTSVHRVLILDGEPTIRTGIRRPVDVDIPNSIPIVLGSGVTQLFDVLQIKEIS